MCLLVFNISHHIISFLFFYFYYFFSYCALYFATTMSIFYWSALSPSLAWSFHLQLSMQPESIIYMDLMWVSMTPVYIYCAYFYKLIVVMQGGIKHAYITFLRVFHWGFVYWCVIYIISNEKRERQWKLHDTM